MKTKIILCSFFLSTIFLITGICYGQNTGYDYYIKSFDMVKIGDYTKANEFIDKAIAAESQNHEYIAYKGFILRNLQNYIEALKCMQKAIQLNPNIGWYYVEALVSSYNLKNIELSKTFCEKALTFGKNSLGDSNYDYVISISQSLYPVEYTLNFKFYPNLQGLVYEKDGTLCLPVPSSDLPYQQTTCKITGATLVRTSRDNDYELIFLKANGNDEISIQCIVKKTPFSFYQYFQTSDLNSALPKEIEPYLKSSDLYNLSSVLIKNTALPLKGKNDFETVLNTINWLNKTKNKGKIPPVWSNADDLIKAANIECGTGSLLVVVLLRANGIAARQVWGPVDAGSDYSPENYLKGHVWFEFYLRGYGWIPVEQFDPAGIGILPVSYIRVLTNPRHLYNNIPLSNLMTIMNTPDWGDIIQYQKKILK